MKDLLLVNPPLIHFVSEEAGNELGLVSLIMEDALMKSINIGIVSLANHLLHKGFSVDIIDLYFDHDVARLKELLRSEKYRFVGVSCVTGFSYLSSMECFRAVKEIGPETITIGGGSHLGPLGEVGLKECPQIEIIAQYEGEIVLEMLLNGVKPKHIDGIIFRDEKGVIKKNSQPSPLIDLNEMPLFDLSIYPNYLDYLPFVEESRGCFAQCSYCVNCFINQRKIRVKNYENFARDLDHALKLYGKERTYIVQALSFGINLGNTQKILKVLRKTGIEWAVEFRVDGPAQHFLCEMYESGCRFCDLGLESASSKMLALMRKTKNPEKYLRMASELVKKATSFPELQVCLNILFFLGENPSTLRETLNFIVSHEHQNLVVSAFPVLLFPGVALWKEITFYESNFGASVVRGGYWDKSHIHPANLSSSFSFSEILHFAKVIQRIYPYRKKTLT